MPMPPAIESCLVVLWNLSTASDFRDPSDALPANTYSDETKVGVAYQLFSQYQYYLDLIRNEKPISGNRPRKLKKI